MTKNEIKALLARMAIHWPAWKGPDSQTNLLLTLSEFEEYLGADSDADVRSALRSYVAAGNEFPPTMGQLHSGALSIATRRRVAEAPQLPQKVSKADPATRRAIELALATQAASLEKHKHSKPIDGSSGAEECEVCKAHDHSDTRRAGHTVVTNYNMHSQSYVTEDAIPMWMLACPLCGWPEMPMSAWTSVAIGWVKNHHAPAD